MKRTRSACALLAMTMLVAFPIAPQPAWADDDGMLLDPNGMIELGPTEGTGETPEFTDECGEAVPIDPNTGEPDPDCVPLDPADEALDEENGSESESGVAVVENDTGRVVTGLYLKPAHTNDWTMNYLDDDGALDVGEMREIELPHYLGHRCEIVIRFVMSDDGEEIDLPEGTISVNACEEDIVLRAGEE